MRKVKCIETKRIFENAEEAGKWLGVSEITIRSACNGNSEKAKGLTFEYVVEKKKRNKRVEQESLFKEIPTVEAAPEAKEELKEITPEDFKDKKMVSVSLTKINEIIRYTKEK